MKLKLRRTFKNIVLLRRAKLRTWNREISSSCAQKYFHGSWLEEHMVESKQRRKINWWMHQELLENHQDEFKIELGEQLIAGRGQLSI